MFLLKSEEEILTMKEGGSMLAETVKELQKRITPGISTKELDSFAEQFIIQKGAKPSFKGYRGFPATVCTSLNDIIVHGIPSEKPLKEGDILSLDIGLYYKGFHSDMAVTVPVGKVDGDALRLIKATKKALKRGIKKVREGNTLGDLGNTIERYVHKSGFEIVYGLCGHGIGRNIHEEPNILNTGKRRKEEKMIPGVVFCIEPMLSMGSGEIKEYDDGRIGTADGSLSAHFEHTVALTEKGCVVLTE